MHKKIETIDSFQSANILCRIIQNHFKTMLSLIVFIIFLFEPNEFDICIFSVGQNETLAIKKHVFWRFESQNMLAKMKRLLKRIFKEDKNLPLPWHLQTLCIFDRTARLPASLLCLLISNLARVCVLCVSWIDSSAASSHSRENFSPKWTSFNYKLQKYYIIYKCKSTSIQQMIFKIC